MNLLADAALVLAGLAAGLLAAKWRSRVAAARGEAERLRQVEEARRAAETLLAEARLKAAEESLRARQEHETHLSQRSRSLNEAELRLGQLEAQLGQRRESLSAQEVRVQERESAVRLEESRLAARAVEMDRLQAEARGHLERLGGMSEGEARAALLQDVERRCQRDAADLSRRILDDAKNRAEEQARRIIGLAVQRYAGRHTVETTTATLALVGDDMKGRIIGRDGRNIRAFEAATGVTVLIDDTPNAVVLSGFDPVRREIARESMQRLMADGRIHPTRIEEVVAAVGTEMDDNILKWAEEAVASLGLPPLPREILRKLGSLRFRHSFSQNILQHSVEVAHLMALMAAEMGLDPAVAKKAGLLHDIGKAMDHEVEGPHAIVGAEFIRRHGEPEPIVNAVASHHDEVPHTNVYGILVSAADAISASRPGARSEVMTTYIKRLEALERIGNSFQGVERTFALQAGREVRVFVSPGQVTDDQAAALARGIVHKIQDELQYPGQIRVTVVREIRVTEYAK